MVSAVSNAGGRNRKSSRLRPLPPEVNARNLAIEKQRREALNEKFLVRVLPSTLASLTEPFLLTLCIALGLLDGTRHCATTK